MVFRSEPLSKENKALLKYLGIIFVAVLITYKLPQDSYSIIQYIVRPIRFDNSVLTLSGAIPLILFFIGIRGLLNLERFKGKSKIFLFLIMIILLIPGMKKTLDFTSASYFYLLKSGLQTIDIEDSDVKFAFQDNELTINFKLVLIDFGKESNQFKIKAHLPEKIATHIGKEILEFKKEYRTYGHKNVKTIEEEMVIQLDNKEDVESLMDSQWFWETFQYELYNENESIKIIVHGI